MRLSFPGNTRRSSVSRGTSWWALLLLFSPVGASGQHYPAVQVQARADSVLRQRLGPALMAQTRYEARIFYWYRSWSGRKKYKALMARRKTKGQLLTVDVRYLIRVFPTRCTVMDTITGLASVALDSQLHLREGPILAFIPDFLWRQQPCDLLSREQVLAISHEAHLQPGLESPTAELSYDAPTKAFTWSVYNYLTRSLGYANRLTGNVEVVEIDASTGRVKNHATKWYGVVR